MHSRGISLGLGFVVVCLTTHLFPAACPALFGTRRAILSKDPNRSAFKPIHLSKEEFNALVQQLIRFGKKGSEILGASLLSYKLPLSDAQIDNLLAIANACGYDQLEFSIIKVYRSEGIPSTCRLHCHVHSVDKPDNAMPADCVDEDAAMWF